MYHFLQVYQLPLLKPMIARFYNVKELKNKNLLVKLFIFLFIYIYFFYHQYTKNSFFNYRML